MEEVMMEPIDEFYKEGIKLSPTFKFLVDYVKRVSLPLKTFITASRQGKWKISVITLCNKLLLTPTSYPDVDEQTPQY